MEHKPSQVLVQELPKEEMERLRVMLGAEVKPSPGPLKSFIKSIFRLRRGLD